MKAFSKYLIASLLLVSIHTAFSKPFENLFTDSCMRYDFELVGDKETVTVVHKQTKVLSKWAGNPNNLIDELDYGTYRYSLKRMANGQVIFSQGFCPLFQEYQTTPEAKFKKQSYYHAIYFPKPKEDVILIIETRNEKNNWKAIYSDTLNTKNYFVIDEEAKCYEKTQITINGNTANHIDIAIISEGYRADEMNKFISDTKRLTDFLFTAQPFSKYANKFNIIAVKVPSLESGTDIPGSHIFKNTAFNSHFYTFNTERYLTTSDMKSIYDALDDVPFDQIFVLVNTEKYGGGGFYNFMNLCTSDNEKSPFVFIHEFGHGFAGLADEYYSSSTSFEEFYKPTVEPWEPNLTTLTQFNRKWKHLIDKNIPIPTPRNSEFSNKVGVFEGGGYVEKGVYSPMMTCWMKEQLAGKFCPVCEQSIEKVIIKNTR